MESKEVRKLDTQDVELILKLKNANKDLMTELGQIKLAEINLEKRIKSANEYLVQLSTKEAEISKGLEDKYGKGSIDIESGTFHPLK